MSKKRLSLLALWVFSLACLLHTGGDVRGEGGYRTLLSPPGKLSIVRRPPAADYSRMNKNYTELPKFNPDPNAWDQLDFRNNDLSRLEVQNRFDDLIHATFDSKTIWPAKLPKGYDPAEIMDLGRNPGLNVRQLHARGITGKGVGLAIIDQGLLVDHVEYKDRLKLYEEIHCVDFSAAMHGPAVASIAVGKTVGVAPGADLYYIAETHGTGDRNDFSWDLGWLAKSIDRIVTINKQLKRGKIRVISISLGKDPALNGFAQLQTAIDHAEKENIHVIMVGPPYRGAGRYPLADPDRFTSFEPGFFYGKSSVGNSGLIIPMDSRCTAAPTGQDDYAFYRFGGMSWTVPYAAGLYALACQVKPAITPAEFLDAALKTGAFNQSERGRFGAIVDPVKLIAYLEKKNR